MTAFNPATFSARMTLQTEEQRNAPLAADPSEAMHAASELLNAASRFELRGQTNNAATCRDIARKLEQFGSFASDKQREYAVKLIEWSKPRMQTVHQIAKAAPARDPETRLPRLFDLMQRLSKLTIGELTVTRKNQDSLCWVKHEDAEKVVGRLSEGVLSIYGRPGIDMQAVLDALLLIEADPEAAAALHGKLSGRCALCSRDLTDPTSIERGIGPVCIAKAGW